MAEHLREKLEAEWLAAVSAAVGPGWRWTADDVHDVMGGRYMRSMVRGPAESVVWMPVRHGLLRCTITTKWGRAIGHDESFGGALADALKGAASCR